MRTFYKLFLISILSLSLCQEINAQIWTTQTSGVTTSLKKVCFVSARQGWVVGDNGTILRTTDGGITWVTLNSGTTTSLTCVSFVSASIGWVVGINGLILKTTDGGNNWTTQTSNTTKGFYGVSFVNATTGWAVGENGTIRGTTDGGTTWATQTTRTTATLFSVQAISTSQAVSIGSNTNNIYTTNAGTSWPDGSASGIGATFLKNVFYASPTKGWVVGASGTILSSSNGGVDYSLLSSGITTSLNDLYFTSITQGWVVGASGIIRTTSDAGVTWSTQTSGVTSILNGVHFTSATQGFAVGDNGTILKYGIPSPSIITTGTLTAFSTCTGVNSEPQSFTVSGNNLTGSITIQAPTGYAISTTAGSGYNTSITLPATSGSVAPTSIYVVLSFTPNFNPTAVICNATGATTQTVAVSGAVGPPTITLGTITSVINNTTSFNIPYTATTGSPNQYSLSAGTPAMLGFTAMSNAVLNTSPIAVTIPASAANTYAFNLTVKNSITGCVSANVPVNLQVVLPAPSTKYVTMAGGGDGSGSSWTNAISTSNFPAKLAAGNSGDQFWVAAGTYKPTTNSDRTQTFSIPNAVKVYGGFVGSETLLSQRNSKTNQTILSGDIGTLALTDNSYQIVTIGDANNATQLDGFTVLHGYNNQTGSRGGSAIYTYLSSPIIANCIFFENFSFSTTVASFSSGGDGGAIYILGTTGTDAAPSFNNCFFYSNTANGGTNGGGAIRAEAASTSYTNCVFWGNATSTGNGGALSLTDGVQVLTNCTFYNNSMLLNVAKGGAVYINTSNASTATLRNNIFYTNTYGSATSNNTKAGADIYFDGTGYTQIVTNSITQSFGTTGTNGNKVGVDPKFVDINNLIGADAIWGTTDDGLQIQNGSPAIDAGIATGAPASDIVGVSRPKAAGFDIGAYEYQASAPTILSFLPVSAKPGDIVTITGTNFNTTPANNTVFFGASKAMVTAATNSSLTVTVPIGATYGVITALNAGTFLVCSSNNNFNPIFSPAKTAITINDFQTKVDFATGTSPEFVVMGDFDGDGKPDLAVANAGTNNMSIFRNTSTSGTINAGSFAPKVDLAVGFRPYGIAIGDLDADGKLDLAVITYGTGNISVFRNNSTNGNISFDAKVDFVININANPYKVVIKDLNGDGKLDICAYGLNSVVSVFLNQASSGTISTSSFANKVDLSLGAGFTSIAIVDMDGDGKPDFIGPNYAGSSISICRNISTNGGLSFAAKVDFAAGTNPLFVVVGDLDADGKSDVVVANSKAPSVSVLKNTSVSGSLSFNTKVDFTASIVANTVSPGALNWDLLSLGDFDGDSKPDIAIINNSSTIVSILRNTSVTGTISSSSFATNVDFTTGTGPVSLINGDLDGDGKPDLIIANATSNTISVLRNANLVLPPSITITGTLNPFITCQGVNSAQQSFKVSGNNLNSDINIDAPIGYLVSNTSGSGFTNTLTLPATAGSVAATPIYIILVSNPINNPAIVSCNSAIVTSQNVIVNGTINASAITVGNIANVTSIATSFSISFTGSTGNPDQYTLTASSPAMTGFNTITNAVLSGSPITVAIPASSSNTYGFNLTVKNSSTGCASANIPINLKIVLAPPSITYSSVIGTKTYTLFTPIANLTLTNTGGIIPAQAAYSVTTIAGNGSAGAVDNANGLSASFNQPSSIALDPAGNLIITDNGNNKIRKINISGTNAVTTIAGTGANNSTDNLNSLNASFRGPYGIAIDASGIIYIAEYYGNKIRKIDPSGTNAVTTIAGSGTISSLNNVNGLLATFSSLGNIVLDKFGNLYATEVSGNKIRKISLSGIYPVTSIAGTGVYGSVDNSNGLLASFGSPFGIAIDALGDLIVSECNGNKIRKVSMSGTHAVTSYAGSGNIGSADNLIGLDASFWGPAGIVFDSTGYLYVADYNDKKIRKISPIGTNSVATIAGNGVGSSIDNNNGLLASFNLPGTGNIVIDSLGNLYVAEYKGNKIRKVDLKGYNISPTLPAGLIFDPTNGTISGTPKVGSKATLYTISGINAVGSNSTSITIATVLPAPPTIISFTPTSAKPGDIVTITGTNFNAEKTNNIVFIGATKAVVNTASATSLTVTVPLGATYAPITELNTGISLSATSGSSFMPIYSPAKTNFSAADFDTKIDSTTGISPFALAISDLDGDGKSDIITTNQLLSKTISVLQNISEIGKIRFKDKMDLKGGVNALSIAISDMDGDGKSDLVVPSVSTNTVSILRNTSVTGTITFSAETSFKNNPIDQLPTAISVGTADIDADGRNDIIVVNNLSNNVSVLRNTSSIGDLSFESAKIYATGTKPSAIAIADLDGDGKLDLAITNATANTVSIFKNTSVGGTIRFEAVKNFRVGTNPLGIVIGDFNADGRLDIAITTSKIGKSNLSILKGIGTIGTIDFATNLEIEVQSSSSLTTVGSKSIVISDVDGNGKPDLVLSSGTSPLDQVFVVINTSSNDEIAFTNVQGYTALIDANNIAAGDLDGDGMPDLVSVSQKMNKVSVLRNMIPPPTIGFVSPVNPNSLGGFIACSGKASDVKSFKVVGVRLTSNITITAPIGFELSSSASGLFNSSIVLTQNNAIVDTTIVFVRLSSVNTNATSNDSIRMSAVGATTKALAVIPKISATPSAPNISTSNALTLCAGNAATLNASIIALNNTLNWYRDGVSINTNGLLYTASIAGSYTATETNINSGCISAPSKAVSVVVNASPIASITEGSQLAFTNCAATSISLTANIGIGLTYQWLLEGVDIPTATAANLSVVQPGNFAVRITNSNNCTSISTSTKILALPSATSNGATAVCAGNTVALTANISGFTNATYQWLKDDVVINDANSTNLNYAAIATGKYSLRIISAGNVSTSCPINISINTLPLVSITASPSNSICVGTALAINANAATAISYQWLNGTTPISSASANAISIAESGTYSVLVNDANGCLNTSAATNVTVNSLPIVAPITGTTFLSVGATTFLANNTIGGTFTTSNSSVATVNSATGLLTGITAGSAIIKYSVQNNAGCTTVVSTNITVNAITNKPTIVAATPTVFCAGGSVVLTSSAISLNQWSKDGILINGAMGITYTAKESGNYSVVVGENFASSDPITVTVNALPIAIIQQGTQLAFANCANTSINLTANTVANAIYQWSNASGIINAANTANYLVTQAGSYAVRITDQNNCSVVSNATKINAIPTATVNGNTAVCAGTQITLNADASSFTIPIYQWQNAGVNIVEATNASYTPTVSGSYTVLVTDGGVIASSCNIDVAIFALPIVSIAAATSGSVCTGTNIGLTAAPSNAASYQWLVGGNANSVTTINRLSVGLTGRYSVQVTDANGCINTSEENAVTINSTPIVAAINGAQTICANSNTIFSNTTENGVWNSSDIAVASVDQFGTINGLAAGIATINYTVTVNGCATTVTKNVTITAATTISVQPSKILTQCSGTSATISVVAIGDNLSYQWYKNANLIAGATASTYTDNNLINTDAGDYTVVVTGNCGSVTSNASVWKLNPTPEAIITEGFNVALNTTGTINLTANIGVGLSYRWFRNAQLINTQTSATLTVTQIGSYTVEVTNTAGCASAISAATIVSVMPTITAGGATTFCAGGSVGISVTTGNGQVFVRWKDANNQTVGTNTLFIATVTGNYSAEINTGGNNLQTTLSVQVSVNVLPVISISSNINPAEVCAGSNVLLTAIGALSYQWLQDNGAINTAVNGSFTANESGLYSVRATDVNGCVNLSPATKVLINTAPVASILAQGNTVFCKNNNVVLTSASNTGNQWYKDGVVINGANGISYTANASANYSVEVISVAGCSAMSAATVVTMNPLPTATITNGIGLVLGDNGIVTLAANTGTGLSYTWFLNASIIKGESSRSINVNQVGTYMVQVTNATGCSALSVPSIVGVLPTASISASTEFCAGGSVLISVILAADQTMVRWKDANGITVGNATTNFTATTTGSYVAEINTAGGLQTTQSVKVKVNALPIIDVSSNLVPASICAGGTVGLTATGGISYQWIQDNNAITIASATANYLASLSGTYTVIASNSNGCIATSSAISVTVNALPKLTAVTGVQQVCAASKIVYANTTTGGVWSSGTTSIATISTTGIITGVSAGISTISYTVTNASGCVTVVTREVTVNALPTVASITGTQEVCVGLTTAFANATTGGVWSSGTTNVATVNGSGVVSGVSAGTATISFTVTNISGCVTVVTREVPVNALPTVAAIKGTQEVCVGLTTAFTSTTTSGVWSSGTTSVATVNASSGVVSGVSAGTATISYRVTNLSGCITTVTRDVTVNTFLTVAPITGVQQVCFQATTPFASTTTGGVWSSNNITAATIDAGGIITGRQSGTATISYTVTNAVGGCVTIVTRDITVNALPVITATANPTLVNKGQNTQLNVSAVGNIASFVWSPSGGTLTTNPASTTVRVTQNTTYTVTATSTAGCIATANVAVTTKDDIYLETVNVFTPNGDGINDKFVIKNLDLYPNNKLQVFDRTGKIIYEQNNYANNWDGTVNGKLLTKDTYFYVLIVNGQVVKKATITLVR